MWMVVWGLALTLPLCPALQKRNRAMTARRQHLKVGATPGEGRRGPHRQGSRL